MTTWDDLGGLIEPETMGKPRAVYQSRGPWYDWWWEGRTVHIWDSPSRRREYEVNSEAEARDLIASLMEAEGLSLLP